ncbi:MAG: hypothetical protein ACXWZ1_02890, partial [Gaiellaceae bacterium]
MAGGELSFQRTGTSLCNGSVTFLPQTWRAATVQCIVSALKAGKRRTKGRDLVRTPLREKQEKG